MKNLKILIFCALATAACSSQAQPSEQMQRLLQLHNELRLNPTQCKNHIADWPLEGLVWSNEIADVAQQHSEFMAKKELISHRGKRRKKAGDRLNDQGYEYSLFAENLGAGPTTPEMAMAAWISSEPHCNNVIRPTLTEMGAAEVEGYWTVIMATPKP